ncbi:uncharacterized protein LOC128958351 [Oppia nitens]|uniref:uncharacterized protein LOC128958351 n=1 Tax=Oppia nitens TaxID=1686743 RepID=UPI0023DC255D|nr:uncharacterized protein LOC128958351 [Oppia nitens]
MNLIYLKIIIIEVLLIFVGYCYCDTWITLWNKVDLPIEVVCKRDGHFKRTSFKIKTLQEDQRYDIKAKYPNGYSKRYYRHWCDVTVGTTNIQFDVFGGRDKRVNKLSDSYSDWIITRGGIYRVKKGSLILYYGKNWLGEDYEDLEDAVIGTPEKTLNPSDTQKIAPLEVHLTSSTLTLAQQRLAIDKATYASHKFTKTKAMGKYIGDAMKKKFGHFWAVFIDQPENTKVVKRTCDTDQVMIFQINNVDFIVCQVMR